MYKKIKHMFSEASWSISNLKPGFEEHNLEAFYSSSHIISMMPWCKLLLHTAMMSCLFLPESIAFCWQRRMSWFFGFPSDRESCYVLTRLRHSTSNAVKALLLRISSLRELFRSDASELSLFHFWGVDERSSQHGIGVLGQSVGLNFSWFLLFLFYFAQTETFMIPFVFFFSFCLNWNSFLRIIDSFCLNIFMLWLIMGYFIKKII